MTASKNGTYLKLGQVAAYLDLHQATIYRLIKNEGFPRPVKLSPGIARWKKEDVDEWLAGRRHG